MVSAWKEGYYVGGAAVGVVPMNIRLQPHPLADSEEYRWVAPWPDPTSDHNCGNCHREIYEEWQASSHSRATINPRFLNLYDGTDRYGVTTTRWNLKAEHPLGVGVCAACHAPSLAVGEQTTDDLRRARDVPAQGVHCDFCHKVIDTQPDGHGLTHGRYAMQLLRPREEPLFFGPLDDVVRKDTFAPVYRDSRYCASCHEGVMFGIHVYSTFSEWQQSPAAREGKQCQSCHMAPTGRLRNIAPGHGGIDRDPATLASHCDPVPRDEMLYRCLHVQTTTRPQPDGVLVTVTISMTDVGHRMPTGYIDRQLILVLEAMDSGGKGLRLQSGPVLPDIVGSLRGAAGCLFAKQPVGFDGQAPAPFWIAQPGLLDTRLMPERPQQTEFLFPVETRRLRVRLLYRRFWEEQTRIKRWPSTEIVVHDRTIDIGVIPQGRRLVDSSGGL
jgi:nitrate/TMAO reductase-like tetraheme cytochrome c subunit